MSSENRTSDTLSRACLHCGRTSANEIRIGPISGICSVCYAIPGLGETMRCRELPTSPAVCPFPPGSEEKIQWMTARVEAGYSPFSIEDSSMEGHRPGCIAPQGVEIFGLPMLRVRGVERVGNRWRARPAFEERKHTLGIFATRLEAEAAAWRFWVERLGIFSVFGGTSRHRRHAVTREEWNRLVRLRKPPKKKYLGHTLRPFKYREGEGSLFEEEHWAVAA